MVLRRIGLSSLALLLLPVSHSQETAGLDLDQHVNQAIDNWSSSHKTIVTVDARRQLVMDAHSAVWETTRQYPKLDAKDVTKVIPSAMVAFLTDTQNNTTAATLPQLVQERITGFGQVLPQPSDYPTLSVSVAPPKPPDFVVSINGVAYQAGSSLFRLKTGLTQVRVARAGHASCDKNITITQTGPNVVTCRL